MRISRLKRFVISQKKLAKAEGQFGTYAWACLERLSQFIDKEKEIHAKASQKRYPIVPCRTDTPFDAFRRATDHAFGKSYWMKILN